MATLTQLTHNKNLTKNLQATILAFQPKWLKIFVWINVGFFVDENLVIYRFASI